jgi:ferredoxin--NADP+ reductase
LTATDARRVLAISIKIWGFPRATRLPRPQRAAREQLVSSALLTPIMSAFNTEHVLSVHHWNDTLFSFKTTRDPALRFHNGHFVMLGLEVNGKPLMRAYSIASANYEEELEFLSIKVQNGPLTSRLQHLKVGDPVLVSRKPVGTLVIDDLLPGKHLYLFGTGTGLAPFMSIIKDPETYERFEKIVLVHGVRFISELAYSDFIQNTLPSNEFFGDVVRDKLIYYPTVTREEFRHKGRLTDLLDSGKMAADLGLPELHPSTDRVMLCGSPSMLADTCKRLDERGFKASPHTGQAGDYVIERAFVEK